ncbi:MAG: LD-carboxypeptidase, partial [Lentisphaeria bacterium]|nr:LD-carboxypeptidase [Lentisphaeria bacterium]
MNRFLIMLGSMLSLIPGLAAAQDAELHPEKSDQERRLAGVFPPGVKTIACITPASYPGSSSHRRCPELLKKAGYKVKIFPHSFDKPEPGKTYAPLEGRLEDFYAAWNDPEVDFILCFRGGGGSRGLMEALDLKKLKKRDNLYLQGYSDVTHVISWMLAKGYGRPIAGPMCGSLVGITPDSLREMKA